MRERREAMTTSGGRLAALLVVAWISGRATVDPDLWGHLRFGLDLVQTGRLVSVDPYSFTQDVAWVNHEWLSELAFALAYRSGGVLGLVLLKTAIMGLAAWLLLGIARRAQGRVRWWLLCAVVAGLAPAAATFRPQLWTVLGLAVICRVLADRRTPKWLPALFAVWANLHGGWIVGAGVVALWIVGRAIDGRSVRAVGSPLVVLAASVAATMMNPYGWRLWWFLLSTVRMTRNVTEWRPLWEQTDWSQAVLWSMTAVLVGIAIGRRWRDTEWATLIPVVWLGGSALLVGRLAPLAAEVALLATAHAWSSSGSVRAAVAPRPLSSRVVDLVCVAVVWALNAVPAARCLPIAGPWTPDRVAAGAFASPATRGRLVLPFDWGEYAIWHWAPRLRVSMDGRRETVYSEATINRNAAMARGEPVGLEYLKQAAPEYIWLPLSDSPAVVEWLSRNGYRVDTRTSRSFVATRADLPILAPAPPLPSCFP